MAVSSVVDLDSLARIGRALGAAYPTELADQFAVTRANLSNHLTCLRECGLVTATAEGRRVRYDLADPRLTEALTLLAALDLPGRCDT